jgi:hypothetical protein
MLSLVKKQYKQYKRFSSSEDKTILFTLPEKIDDDNIKYVLENIKFHKLKDNKYLYPCFEYIVTSKYKNQLKSEYPEFPELFDNESVNSTLVSASRGNLFALIYAHEHDTRCKWSDKINPPEYPGSYSDPVHWDDTCRYAALNGHLECLKYLHTNGCPWNSNTCEAASFNGHLDCLIYAFENGCPWNSTTCEAAAINGHLDCLKYAHENGCKWNINTYEAAVLNNNIECMLYMNSNGFKISNN